MYRQLSLLIWCRMGLDVPSIEIYTAHGGGGDGQTVVLVELLRQISPLRSEEPVEITRLFVRRNL